MSNFLTGATAMLLIVLAFSDLLPGVLG